MTAAVIPTVKVVGATGRHNEIKTVNVVTEKTNINVTKSATQAATVVTGNNPTYQVAPTGTKGIPTIYVAGFTGPA
jgi:hypothetical protein